MRLEMDLGCTAKKPEIPWESPESSESGHLSTANPGGKSAASSDHETLSAVPHRPRPSGRGTHRGMGFPRHVRRYGAPPDMDRHYCGVAHEQRNVH